MCLSTKHKLGSVSKLNTAKNVTAAKGVATNEAKNTRLDTQAKTTHTTKKTKDVDKRSLRIPRPPFSHNLNIF